MGIRRMCLALTAGAALAGVLCSCQMAHVKEPLTQTTGGSDPDAQMSFWHDLATRPVTCNDEAFHALLLYVDSKDDATDYDGRIKALRARGMLPAGFNAPANEAVSRGVLAYALVKMLGIQGGWVMHVFGPSERYAVRELMYEGMYPPSSPQQTFSGTEFLGIMGKAEDYRREHYAEIPEPAENVAGEAAAGGANVAGASTQQSPAPFGHGLTTRPTN